MVKCWKYFIWEQKPYRIAWYNPSYWTLYWKSYPVFYFSSNVFGCTLALKVGGKIHTLTFIRKEKTRLSLFANDLILYIENIKEPVGLPYQIKNIHFLTWLFISILYSANNVILHLFFISHKVGCSQVSKSAIITRIWSVSLWCQLLVGAGYWRICGFSSH